MFKKLSDKLKKYSHVQTQQSNLQQREGRREQRKLNNLKRCRWVLLIHKLLCNLMSRKIYFWSQLGIFQFPPHLNNKKKREENIDAIKFSEMSGVPEQVKNHSSLCSLFQQKLESFASSVSRYERWERRILASP